MKFLCTNRSGHESDGVCADANWFASKVSAGRAMQS